MLKGGRAINIALAVIAVGTGIFMFTTASQPGSVTLAAGLGMRSVGSVRLRDNRARVGLHPNEAEALRTLARA